MPRLARSRRPVLQPWEAPSFDPEDTGEWGATRPEEAEPQGRKNWRLAWLGLAVAVPLGAVMIWQSAARPPAAGATPPPLITPIAIAPPTAADLARLAADTARDFLATSSVDDRARFVRHPEITRERMTSWHSANRPLRPLAVTSFHERWAEESVGDHTFVMLYMEMADFTTRAIALEKLPDGGLLVDWESFESWSELPWTQYLESEPAESTEFRVIAERDTYFNFAFADSSTWLCFRLNDPANEAHGWGYCRTDSEVANALRHLFRRQRQQGTSQVKAMLRLRFAGAERGRRQVLIESLVQDHWLKADP